jgi:capsid protein
MNFIQRAHKAGRTLFGYDSVEGQRGNRRPVKTKVTSEDLVLTRDKRKKGISTARDDHRNNTLLKWAVEHHLNYVSRFRPFYRSGNEFLDQQVNGLLRWHGNRQNWDISKRHNRDRWMRLWELQRVLCGDIFAIKTKLGALQAIESDRVTTPTDWNGAEPNPKLTPHGLLLDKNGAVLKYAICNRTDKSNQFVLDHMEAAENIVASGYFTRFDQTRGISPVLTSLSLLADVDDGLRFNLLKVKLQALFGLAFYRDSVAPLGAPEPNFTDDEDGEPEEEGYNVEMSPDKVTIFDLDPGDRVEAIESNSPAESVIQFSELEIRIVLKALDIPYTAFDSLRSSHSARVADRNEYEEAAEWKREDNIATLTEIYEWRFNYWARTNDSLKQAMKEANVTAQDVVRAINWVPAGTPWLDKLNEVKADVLALSIGAESTPRICARHGLNAYQIADEQADFIKYCKEREVPLLYADPGKEAVQNILNEEPDGGDDEQ